MYSIIGLVWGRVYPDPDPNPDLAWVRVMVGLGYFRSGSESGSKKQTLTLGRVGLKGVKPDPTLP